MRTRYNVSPLIPVARNAYKDTISYNRPKKIASIWEWFEKEWRQWVDDLACRWVDYRKFIKKESYLSEVSRSYETFVIDDQDVVRSIFEYMGKHNYSVYGRIKYVLVGYDVYPVLKNNLAIQFPIQYLNECGQMQLAGAQILFVPNMNGLLFLTDLPEPIN